MTALTFGTRNATTSSHAFR